MNQIYKQAVGYAVGIYSPSKLYPPISSYSRTGLYNSRLFSFPGTELTLGIYVGSQLVNSIVFSAPSRPLHESPSYFNKIIWVVKDSASKLSPDWKAKICMITDNLWITTLAFSVVSHVKQVDFFKLLQFAPGKITESMVKHNMGMIGVGIVASCALLHIARIFTVHLFPDSVARYIEPSYVNE